MTPRELILNAAGRLREAGVPNPLEDSAFLLSSLCHQPPLNLRMDMETVLSQDILMKYDALLQRREAREPLQYILCEAPFMGRLFYVDPRVLIPRPETALLCEWALEILKDDPALRILDLCTGSGCIGITMQCELENVQVTLSDLSEDALSVAAVNARRYADSIQLHQGDLLDGFASESFDFILSNPPYIPSSDCMFLQKEVCQEPLIALDGGDDGLDFYRRIARDAPGILSSHGGLMLELGWQEAPAVSDLLLQAGMKHITVRRDYAGISRVIYAVKE